MYTLCGLVTCLLTYQANKLLISRYKTNRKVGNALLVLIVLIFSTMAALRDYNIGTDISYYVTPVFYNAKRMSFREYWVINSVIIEPLYLILNYLIAMFTDDPRLLMGCIELIVSGFILLRLSDYKMNRRMWIGVFIFNFAFFPISLNLMRQSIAMAIIFYATRYIFSDKLNIHRFILWVVISMGFHLTGIIGLFILAFVFYYQKEKNIIRSRTLAREFKTILLIVGLVIMIFLFNKIVDMIIPISGFSLKYSSYAVGDINGFDFKPFLVRSPFLLIIFVYRRHFYEQKCENYLLYILLLTDALTSLLRSYSTTLYRISIFFAYYKMLAIPNLIESLKPNKRLRITFVICLLLYVLWIYQIILQGNEQVYPYTAKWLFN